MVRRIVAMFAVWLVLVATAGCEGRQQAATRVESDFAVMGTEGRIIVYAESAGQGSDAVAAGRAMLEEIERALSTYRQESEVSAINRAAGGEAVVISQLTARAIGAAKEYSRLSGGAFNPLVGSVIRLWRAAAERGQLPSDEDIAAALALLDIEKIELAEHDGRITCRLALSGMELDLGGHAKGWAADEAIAVMRPMSGVRAVLVMLGGDGAGWSGEGWSRPWTFGIQDPREAESRELYERLEALNLAVVTSGNYYRYFEIGGRRYSHIIDPRRGRPIDTDVASATVVDSNAGRADALATACMILGSEEALKMLEGIAGAEGLILQSADGGGLIRHTTSGYPDGGGEGQAGG